MILGKLQEISHYEIINKLQRQCCDRKDDLSTFLIRLKRCLNVDDKFYSNVKNANKVI